jgi:hypothetical protein
MSKANIIGGLLAIIGGLMILISTFISFNPFWNLSNVTWVINLIIGLCAVIGGIFGIKGHRGAGGLVLTMGLLSIFLGIIFAYLSYPYGYNYIQFSLFTQILHQFSFNHSYYLNLFSGISLEAIIVTIGGIFVLASRSEFSYK